MGLFILCESCSCLIVVFDRSCDHLLGDRGIGCFAFQWFGTCAVHCNLFTLLVGYVLWFWFFLVIFFTIYWSINQMQLLKTQKQSQNVTGLSYFQRMDRVLQSFSEKALIYSLISMAQTSFRQWIFVLDISSWSHRALFMAPGQQSNGDNLETSFRSSVKRGDSNEYTQHTISW